MTKNHRFAMYQNTIYDNGHIINSFKCMKLLNQLNDENEQLKSRIEYLETKLQRERKSSTEQHLKWSDEAEERIKELENEIQDFQDILASKEEILLKPVIRMIDDRIEQCVLFGDSKCAVTLSDLKKEITE